MVGSVGGSPANLTVDPRGDPIRVTAVEGTPVSTRAGFERVVENQTVATVETTAGTRTFPVGVYVAVSEGGALDAAGAPVETTVVTHIDGARVTDQRELTAALDDTTAGERIAVETYRNGERQSYEATLDADDDGGGLLGVGVFEGTSGVVLDDFGVEAYPAGTYLELLGGDGGPGAASPIGTGGSLLLPIFVALILPLASFVLGVPNFPGFTGYWTAFYDVQGPLGVTGEPAVFLTANVLFWAAWVNLQLGLFNCIPGYPLDGGRILRSGTEAIVSRLPVADRDRVVSTITTGIGLTMLASLLLLVFGPSLLN